jgi:hypothetical protein
METLNAIGQDYYQRSLKVCANDKDSEFLLESLMFQVQTLA